MSITDTATAAPARARPSTAADYLALLKPRVMSLVIFTACAGYAAAPSDLGPVLGFAAILSIAVGAGAAGALNMWFDADIDAKMRRTRVRPVPSGRVRAEEALGFGVAMAILSVLLMALAAGALPAALLAFTIVFYAVIYTMWLKRSTPHNIVIGGLAGALPPTIAWAAATGTVSADPLLLTAIIFMWTPPHFWALALYQRGDYAAAGVPMLPVTHGAKATRTQILAYSLALAPLGLAPALTGLGGWVYAAVAAFGGLMFVVLALRVARSRAGDEEHAGDPDLYAVRRGARAARDLFAFSILYLFILFGALLAEHAAGAYVPLTLF
ncbi:MAG: protoheme IX farnesyltransferase [Alphaproteobacteria bacterium]|nr:protoheme IX farnesyltransferase [Alphaproteobacteria bacterium]